MTNARSSPAFEAKEVVWLPKGHQQPAGTVRVHNSRIDASRSDQRRFFRRQSVVLTNLEKKVSILLGVIGTPDDVTVPRHGIGLNYEALDALMLHESGKIRVEVRPANFVDLFRSAWSHNDPIVRVSVALGVFGTVLGLISTLIGIL